MPAAVHTPAPRPLVTAAELEQSLSQETPIAVIDAQLLQLAEHPQRLDTESLCELLAVLDQQHRRGRLSSEEFRQLKSRIAPLIVAAGAMRGPGRAGASRRPVASPAPAFASEDEPEEAEEDEDQDEDGRPQHALPEPASGPAPTPAPTPAREGAPRAGREDISVPLPVSSGLERAARPPHRATPPSFTPPVDPPPQRPALSIREAPPVAARPSATVRPAPAALGPGSDLGAWHAAPAPAPTGRVVMPAPPAQRAPMAPPAGAIPAAVPARSAAPAAPAASAPGAAPLVPGRVLRGRYELRRLLGEGGMSCVYEAVDRLRDGGVTGEALVAVKVLRPSLAARPDAVQALRLEFERAQALSHPSIVNVHALDADGDVHFITMERLEGELLGHAIKRLRPAAARRDQAFAILSRLGEAVDYAHEAGVVHADLKPGNVMLTWGGELRLFDFGAAWRAQREPWICEVGERSLQGATPTYASVERLGGGAPTVRDDVFSFSCLAYELLTGQHPFDRQPATEAERLKRRPRRPTGLSGRQWRALKRGLAFRREDRWPDLRGLLDALLPESAASTPLPPRLEASSGSSPARLSGIAMLLLGAAAFAIAHYSGRGLPAPLQDLLSQLGELARGLASTIAGLFR